MRVKNFNWPTGIFLISYHVILLTILPFYFYYATIHTNTVITSIVLLFLTGMSITAGYHRYFAHCTYKTNKWVEAVLLFFASASIQASAIRWAFEHRLHHAHVDTDEDPYSINKGFWYAHILWLFHSPRPIENKIVADLLRKPLVLFQHKHYEISMIASNAIIFLLVGWLCSDFIGAFVLAIWLRVFFLHHFTWFINSLAHTWGARTFSTEQTAVDNYLISFVTFGEGYHNYHHTFANDYRNGVRWYHFDPTKWLIWTLEKLGLAHNLRRVDKYHVKECIVEDYKNRLIEAIKKSYYQGREELEEAVSRVSEDLIKKLSQLRALIESKTNASGSVPNEQYKHEMKTLKKGLREDWKKFKRICKKVEHTVGVA